MHGDMSGSRPTGLIRNLSVWQAVGLSVALMAPSMAANINPQATAGSTGRAEIGRASCRERVCLYV